METRNEHISCLVQSFKRTATCDSRMVQLTFAPEQVEQWPELDQNKVYFTAKVALNNVQITSFQTIQGKQAKVLRYRLSF